MSNLLVRNPNIYYGMGRKRRRVGRPRRRHGGSLFSALKGAHDWIKSHKIISTVGKALGATGLPFAGIANTIGNSAASLGYGRRRRRVVRRRRGGAINVRGILSSAHGFVKLASKLLHT